jgi:DNA-binding MarR family transcriptional regulator
MRLLWELGHQDGASASNLHEYLGVDPAWVSRTLRTFREEGWIDATPAEHDARIRHLTLTGRGRKVLVPLELAANTEVRATLANLSRGQQERLVDAMGTIEELLDEGRDPLGAYGLRDPRPGDFGWIVSHHGAIYAREYGWDERFEGLVAEIVGRYLRSRNPAREHCWIAEGAGERAGCVGSRLVEECIRFSRAAGYRRLMLWTQANLKAATHIYRKKGFRLVKREKHRAFGTELTGETYSLSLTAPGK